ncbi:hypothetical protein, partial [Agrococcus sp. HG114]|uniref:hypothetical protein n=1 Tax=Agrococcus sp. HG114 TaxID=2969757 RepID=UPI00215A698E
MAADDGGPAQARASWASILGLALLFVAWAAVACLALLASRAAWSTLGSDVASSVALALETSAAWVALLASLLLLIVAGRGERGRVAAGGVGLLVGVLGLSAAAVGRGPALALPGDAALTWLPAQGLLELSAVAAAAAGGALL